MEDLARSVAAKQNNNTVAVHPGNKCKLGESRKVRSMRDELEKRKGKEEGGEEPAEEKIVEREGNGCGDATRKTGEDDDTKENVRMFINKVDRIYILQK